MNGNGGSARARPLPTNSRNSSGSPPLVAMAANGFAGVNCAAPAKREDDIAVSVLRAPRSLADQVDRRLSPGTVKVWAESAETNDCRSLAEAPVTTSGAGAECGNQFREGGRCSLAEDNARCVANSKRTFYQPWDRGRRRCTSRFGAARHQGATASRHLA